MAALAYGGKRPLYDIDVDIYKKDIRKVRELFRQFITEDFYRLQSDNFDIWLMTLEIDGVPIDITQNEESYFINPDGKKFSFDANITKAKIVSIAGIDIPVENKEDLIAYKKIIARDTDLEDVRAIS